MRNEIFGFDMTDHPGRFFIPIRYFSFTKTVAAVRIAAVAVGELECTEEKKKPNARKIIPIQIECVNKSFLI